MPVNLQGASIFTNRVRDHRDEIMEQLTQKMAMGASQFNPAPPFVHQGYIPKAPELIPQESHIPQLPQEDVIAQLRNLLGQINQPPATTDQYALNTRSSAEGKKGF